MTIQQLAQHIYLNWNDILKQIALNGQKQIAKELNVPAPTFSIVFQTIKAIKQQGK